MGVFWNFSQRYAFKYLWWFALGFLFVFLTQFLAVAIVEQIKQAIDAADVNGATAKTILPFVGAIAILALVTIVVRTISRLLIFTPARLMEYVIRNDYYGNLLSLQRDFHSKHEAGDLVSRCSNDIAFIRAAYGFGVLQIANVAMTLVLVAGAMYRMDARATLYLAIPTVLAFGVIQLSIDLVMKHWRLANEQLGDLSSLTLASYKGVSAIQNYHAEPAMGKRFNWINDKFLGTQTKIALMQTFVLPTVKLVENLSIFFILFFIGPKVIQGSLTIGEVTAFLGYIGLLMPPLRSIGWMLNVFNRSIPAIERLDEVLLAVPDLPAVAFTEKDLPNQPQTLTTKGLSFGFSPTPKNQNPFQLHHINLEVTPGKILGIVGPLGSGKSVLLESLLRLNMPSENQLFLGEKDATHISLNAFRDHFSFAPQKAFLFSTTLRQNLIMAMDAKEAERSDLDTYLMDMLAIAGFRMDPKQFPKGLETEVGEKGVMLSGGQRQRIALARALIKPAHVVVLDDVLSAVDHETERLILENLRQHASNKAFVIASHRVSAIQWADEILVMESGKIVQRGTHDTLVAMPGFYREICKYQSQQMDQAS